MSNPTFLYNLKSQGTAFIMAKLDTDFNVAAVYNLTPKGFSYTCDCPANSRSVVTKPCKHKRMMPMMLGAVNTDRFYNPESSSWCQPLGDIDRPQAEPETLADIPMGQLSNTERVVMEALVCEAAPSPIEFELYGSMSPARKELLEEGKAMNARQAIKIEAALAAAPTIRRR